MAEVIFAPDGLELNAALDLYKRIKDSSAGNALSVVKLHDIVDLSGPRAIEEFARLGARPWVDYKLKDVPRTVGLRAQALSDAGASILTVHASGEIDMMIAARDVPGLTVWAITVLTSLDPPQAELSYGRSPLASVLYDARLAKLAGVDGVVCSALEVGYLAKRPELKGLNFTVPGTRSLGVDAGDQKRSDTPGMTAAAGATYLVVASEVTGAEDPVAAYDNFVRQARHHN